MPATETLIALAALGPALCKTVIPVSLATASSLPAAGSLAAVPTTATIFTAAAGGAAAAAAGGGKAAGSALLVSKSVGALAAAKGSAVVSATKTASATAAGSGSGISSAGAALATTSSSSTAAAHTAAHNLHLTHPSNGRPHLSRPFHPLASPAGAAAASAPKAPALHAPHGPAAPAGAAAPKGSVTHTPNRVEGPLGTTSNNAGTGSSRSLAHASSNDSARHVHTHHSVGHQPQKPGTSISGRPAVAAAGKSSRSPPSAPPLPSVARASPQEITSQTGASAKGTEGQSTSFLPGSHEVTMVATIVGLGLLRWAASNLCFSRQRVQPEDKHSSQVGEDEAAGSEQLRKRKNKLFKRARRWHRDERVLLTADEKYASLTAVNAQQTSSLISQQQQLLPQETAPQQFQNHLLDQEHDLQQQCILQNQDQHRLQFQQKQHLCLPAQMQPHLLQQKHCREVQMQWHHIPQAQQLSPSSSSQQQHQQKVKQASEGTERRLRTDSIVDSELASGDIAAGVVPIVAENAACIAVTPAAGVSMSCCVDQKGCLALQQFDDLKAHRDKRFSYHATNGSKEEMLPVDMVQSSHTKRQTTESKLSDSIKKECGSETTVADSGSGDEIEETNRCEREELQHRQQVLQGFEQTRNHHWQLEDDSLHQHSQQQQCRLIVPTAYVKRRPGGRMMAFL